MRMEHPWNDIDRVKKTYLGTTCPIATSVQKIPNELLWDRTPFKAVPNLNHIPTLVIQYHTAITTAQS
jgi:hypothetical protein